MTKHDHISLMLIQENGEYRIGLSIGDNIVILATSEARKLKEALQKRIIEAEDLNNVN